MYSFNSNNDSNDAPQNSATGNGFFSHCINELGKIIAAGADVIGVWIVE